MAFRILQLHNLSGELWLDTVGGIKSGKEKKIEKRKERREGFIALSSLPSFLELPPWGWCRAVPGPPQSLEGALCVLVILQTRPNTHPSQSTDPKIRLKKFPKYFEYDTGMLFLLLMSSDYQA